MPLSRTAARSPLNTWQPSHVYAGLEQTCHLNMPTWAWAEQLHASRWNTWQPDHVYAGLEKHTTNTTSTCQHEHEQNSCTLPAKYLTAKSPLCRFRTNMPLKHANMGVSRTAALSPLNTWQPSHIYAGLEQTCHWNMPTWAICRDWIPKRNGISHNGYINCSSKTGSQPPSGKTTILKHFLKAPFATNEKICCRSTIRNFHAAIAMQITTLCKTQKYYARTRSSEEPWHSHSTAICADGLAQHIRIATRDCRTHRFDAPVPIHKVS